MDSDTIKIQINKQYYFSNKLVEVDFNFKSEEIFIKIEGKRIKLNVVSYDKTKNDFLKLLT